MKKRILNSKKDKLFLQKINLQLDFLTKQETQMLGENSVSSLSLNANFSFKDRADDFENIQNPNLIENLKLPIIKNQKVETLSRFDELSDPFYDFDDERSIIDSKNNTTTGVVRNLSLRLKKTKSSKMSTSKTYGD